MNQKVTLRFADHVLTFVVPRADAAEMAMRRKWIYKFTRANGDFLVNFGQVLWMKISPGDDIGVEQETVQEVASALFGEVLEQVAVG